MEAPEPVGGLDVSDEAATAAAVPPSAAIASAPPADPRPRLQRWFETALTWLPQAVLIAIAPGLTIWPLTHFDTLRFIQENDLSRADRRGFMIAIAISLVVVGLVYGAYATLRVRRAGRPALLDALRAVNDRLLWMIALPIIPALASPSIETEAPFVVFGLSAAAAGILAVWAYRNIPATPPAWRATLDRFAPPVLLGAVIVAYGVIITDHAITQHQNLRTRIFDLGLYDNIFWHNINWNPLGSSIAKGGSHVSAHVDPLLVLLSPIYALWPRAETIQTLQAWWLALGAIPIFLLGRHRTESAWMGLGLALVYALHPALHGANLYDFHSLTLVVPLAMWALFFLESDRLRLYWVALVLMLLTREDISLLSCFIGLYAIVSGRAVKLGLATIVIAIAYLVFVKVAIMPDPRLLMGSSKAYGYAYYYEDMIPHRQEGTRGLIITALSNPVFTLKHALAEPKLVYLAKIFLPLLFLPALARRGRLMLIYGLAFTLLASRDAVYSTHFQYSSVLLPIAVCLVPIALGQLDSSRLVKAFSLDLGRLRGALVVGCIAATVCMSAKFGALVENRAFRTGFQHFAWETTPDRAERYAWLAEAVAQIGPDDSVTSTDVLGPHVSNREHIHMFPMGAGSDWVLVDERSARKAHAAWWRILKRTDAYTQITAHKGLYLLKRNPDVEMPERPAKGKARKASPKRRAKPGRAATPERERQPKTRTFKAPAPPAK
jgi:uncharacterized membrane protein